MAKTGSEFEWYGRVGGDWQDIWRDRLSRENECGRGHWPNFCVLAHQCVKEDDPAVN